MNDQIQRRFKKSRVTLALSSLHGSSGGGFSGLYVVVLMLILASTAGAVWTPPVTMDFNSELISAQDLAVDASSKNAMAVFVQVTSTKNVLYATKYDKYGGWQTPVAISSGSEDASNPHVAVIDNDQFVLVYKQSSGAFQNIYAAKYNGTSWGAPTLLSSGATSCLNPALAGNPPFNAIATWVESNRIQAAVYNGTTWAASAQIDDGSSGNADNPAVSFSRANPGEAIVVFKQFSVSNGNKDRIYANKWSSSSWGTAAIIDANGASIMGPAISGDLNGVAMAVWSEGSNTLYSNKFTGSWLGPVAVGSGPTNISVPVIVNIPSTTTFMCLYSATNSGQKMYAAKYDGTTWGSVAQIDAGIGGANGPSIAVDYNSGNKICAVWAETGHIRSNSFDGTSWLGPVIIDDNANSVNSACVIFNGINNVVIYSKSDGTNQRLYSTIQYTKKVWDNGNASGNWGDPKSWLPDGLPTSTDTVEFENSICAAACNLNVDTTIATIRFMNPVNFNFGNYALHIMKTANFANAGTITAGTANLAFMGTTAQSFVPKTGATFPVITQNGTGGTTVTTNNLQANGLTVMNGTFNLGAGLANTAASFISVGGTLAFGSSSLTLTGNADFSSLAGITPGTGSLVFNGSSAQSFTPKSGATFPAITQFGSGGTAIAAYDLTATSFTATLGTFTVTAGRTMQTTGDLSIAGGTLDAVSGSIDVNGNFTISSGTLNRPNTNPFTIAGSYSKTGGTVTWYNAGSITFDATTSGHTVNIGGVGGGHDVKALIFNGTGGAWTIQTNDIVCTDISLTNGTLNLGSGRVIWVTNFTTSGGTLNFGTSTLKVNGDLNLTALSSMSGTTGTIEFAGASAQTFTPKSANTISSLIQSGTGTTTIAGPLYNSALTINGGTLNMGSGTQQVDSIGGTSGTLDLGSANLSMGAGRIDFSNLSVTMGSGYLTFNPTSGTTYFKPNSQKMEKIYKQENGVCEVISNRLKAGGLFISGGTWDFGTATVFDTLDSIKATVGDVMFGNPTIDISGNGLDLGGVANATSGTAPIRFIRSSGAQRLVPGTGAFPEIIQVGAATTTISGGDATAVAYSSLSGSGTFDIGVNTLHLTNDLTLNGGTFSATSGNLDVGRDVTIYSGATMIAPGAGKTFDIEGDWSSIGGTLTNSGGRVAFVSNSAGNSVAPGSHIFNEVRFSGNGEYTISGTRLKASSLYVGSGTLNLGSGLIDTVGTVLVEYNGTLNLGSSTLRITSTNADFSDARSITASTGKLEFIGTTAQQYTPSSSSSMLYVAQNGTGQLLLMGSLYDSCLAIVSGSVNLGTSLYHEVNVLSVASGTTLDFGSSTLRVTGPTINLSAAGTILSSNGKLEFGGSGPQTYTHKSGLTTLLLSQSGSGGTTIVSAFKAPELQLHQGIFNLGNGSFIDSIGKLTAYSGSKLYFGNTRLKIGGDDDVNLSQIDSVSANNGELEFCGNVAGYRYFTSGDSVKFHYIVQAGIDTVVVQSSDLYADTLSIEGGGFDLGYYLTHSIKTIESTNGTGWLKFGSSDVIINRDADFSQMAGVNFNNDAGLYFDGANVQSLIPHATSILPSIYHTGSGELKLSIAPLKTDSLTLVNGLFNFNGQNVSVTNDLSIINGTPTSISGLAGRTITAGGKTLLAGSSGSLLNLNPASAWTLVSGDTAFALYATLGNCTKSGGIPGQFLTGCIDAGNNTNWTITPPVVRPGTVRYSLRNLVLVQNTAMARDTVTYTGSVVDSFRVFPTLPPGLFCAPLTGVIYGRPTSVWPLTTYIVTAANTAGTATDTITVIVSAEIVAPGSISYATQSPVLKINTAMARDTVTYTGSVVDSFTITPALPSGLILNKSTGVIYGTPTAAQSNTSYTVTAHNTAGTAQTTISITVAEKPQAEFSGTPRSGISPLSVQFADKSSNDVTQWMWDFGDGTIDSSANPDHQFSTAGEYTVKLTVKSPGGTDSLIKTGYVIVENPTTTVNTAPVLAQITDVIIPEDVVWYDTIRATDADNDAIRFAFLVAPKGVLLDSISGMISWMPDDYDIGVNLIIIGAKDVNGGLTLDSFTVTVTNVEEPPVVSFIGDSVATQYARFRTRVQVIDQDPGDSSVIVDLKLPLWLTRSGDTLLGTPVSEDAIGIDSIRITVSDNSGATATALRRITVTNTNDPPVVASAGIPDSIYQNKAMQATCAVFDQDYNDSLYCKSITPSWIKAAMTLDSARNWHVTISGTPAAGSSGMNKISVRIADRFFGEDTLTDSIFVVYVPSTVLAYKKQWYGAASFSVRVKAPDLSHTRFTYSGTLTNLANTKTISPASGPESTFVFYPLTDGKYQFYCAATDQYGVVDPIGMRDTITISGSSFCSFSDTANWHQVAVPALSIGADSVSSGGTLARWDESRPERPIYSYYQTSTDINTLAAGNSFWRKSSRFAAVTLTEGNFLTTAVFAMRLNRSTYGWNQVASPYPFAVQWPDKAVLWKWNAQTKDFEQAGGVLEPWAGYWVLTDSTRTVTLKGVPVFRDGMLAKTSKITFASKTDWQVNISLSGVGNDLDNRIGFNGAASDGYDAMDVPEAPRMGGSSYLYLPHFDWEKRVTEYASDIRKKFSPINLFHIAVAPTDNFAKNKTGTISLNGISNFSEVYAFMESGDSIIPIDKDTSIQIEVQEKTLYKTLFVTQNKNFIKTFPVRFAMMSPFPNPCKTHVNLRYTLPYHRNASGMITGNQYDVKMVMYDAAGRMVRNLLDEKKGPGNYSLSWNGKNNTGRFVANGIYFCNLDAANYHATNKIMVVR